MTDLDENVDTTDDDTDPNANIRQLRQKAKEADRLRAELDQATKALADNQRELAFRAAGIDPTDPKLAYFMRGYDGEIDADKIRGAATEAGFLEPPASGVPAGEREAWARTADIAADASRAPIEDWDSLLAQARTPAEVLALSQRHGRPTTLDGVQ